MTLLLLYCLHFSIKFDGKESIEISRYLINKTSPITNNHQKICSNAENPAIDHKTEKIDLIFNSLFHHEKGLANH